MVLTDFMVKSMLWRTETRRCHPETAWHRELEDLNLNPSPTLTHNFKALNLWIIFDKDKVHKIYLKESSENSLGYPLNPLLGRPLSQDMELVFASQLQVRYRLWQDVASPEDGRCMSSWEWEGWRIKLHLSCNTTFSPQQKPSWGLWVVPWCMWPSVGTQLNLRVEQKDARQKQRWPHPAILKGTTLCLYALWTLAGHTVLSFI